MKNNNRFHVILALVLGLVSINANAAAVSGQGTWETTLQGRDLDGNLSTAEAYYDTVLNITWLADGNYAGTTNSIYAGYPINEPGAYGVMSWDNANLWATSLNIHDYSGWRLPSVNPIDGTTADDLNASSIGTEDRGYNVSAPGTLYAGSTASEMAHLYYNTLGNISRCNPSISTVSNCVAQTGYGLVNNGPFNNVQSYFYWSDTEFVPVTTNAWGFDYRNGGQDDRPKSTLFYAWAVHSGDIGTAVSSVPIPAAFWLFGSGMLGLIGAARR